MANFDIPIYFPLNNSLFQVYIHFNKISFTKSFILVDNSSIIDSRTPACQEDVVRKIILLVKREPVSPVIIVYHPE